MKKKTEPRSRPTHTENELGEEAPTCMKTIGRNSSTGRNQQKKKSAGEVFEKEPKKMVEEGGFGTSKLFL